MEWKPVTPDMPGHDVLLWAGGRCVVGCLVEGETQGRAWRVFMDTRNDELLPSPTHWMPLPHPPKSGSKPAIRALSSSE
ncbi:MAG: DUF551 domain-containing protein [Allosphingosinicella sp.]